jgi:hypothetical protein
VKESARGLLFVVVAVALAVLSYVFFFQPFIREEPRVRDVLDENSTWSVTMQEYFPAGPLSAQAYRISNDNGKISMFYAATNRAGTVTKEFDVPLIGPEGTFLFEELGADGIWELDDQPMRPHPKDEYIIEVDQTLGDEGGTRSFGFSDPEFWATTRAQQFNLRLPAKGAAGANGTVYGSPGGQLRDPRYLQLVKAIEAFGPSTVLEAEDRIRDELAETAKHPVPPQ